MARTLTRLGLAIMAGTFVIFNPGLFFAQAVSPAGSARSSSSSSTQAASDSASSTDAQARRRAARKRQRALALQQQQSRQVPQSTATQVGPSAAQRRRDAQILAAQKAQSADTARENDAVTQMTVRNQQQQQAEPRIQDAPGPGSQPLPGDPAVQPVQPADPPRIQDAPGPAQTLPKAPSPSPAPQP